MFRSIKPQNNYEKLKGHKDSVLTLYSPLGRDGHLLYSASRDGHIKIWDLCTKQILHKSTLKLEQQGKLIFTCILFNDNIVYGSLESGDIYSWNIKSNTIVSRFQAHKGAVNWLLKLANRLLVSGGVDGKVIMWDTMSGLEEKRYDFSKKIDAMRVSADLLYVMVNRRELFVIDTESNHVKQFQILDKICSNMFVTRKYLITNNCDFTLDFYLLDQPLKLIYKKIKLITYWVTSILQLDNSRILLGCDDKCMRFFSLTQWTQVDCIEAHDSMINTIEFCDSNIYSSSTDCSIRAWNLLELLNQQRERQHMLVEDLESKKYETFVRLTKKKSKKGKKK